MIRRVGFARLGRIIKLDPASFGMTGDAEAGNLLRRLALRNPGVEWHLVGKSSGFAGAGLPGNVRDAWDGLPQAVAWGATAGAYRCAFCRAPASQHADVLTCCARAREAAAVEDLITHRTSNLDAMVVYVGNNTGTNVPIPKLGHIWGEERTRETFVTPYVSARQTGAYVVRGVNAFLNRHRGERGRIVYAVPDPRNYLQSRDVAWPAGWTVDEPALAQYNWARRASHERFGDPTPPAALGYGDDARPEPTGTVWRATHHYRHSGLDLALLPDDWEDWGAPGHGDRHRIGVATTAAYLPRRDLRRSATLADWVARELPDVEIRGRWDERARADLAGTGVDVVENRPGEFRSLLESWRSTVVLPPTPAHITGLGWATAKPWQCFAARTVAFMIPPVDDQGWVLPALAPVASPGAEMREVADGLWSVRDDWAQDELYLARWLRVSSPAQLARRVRRVDESQHTWELLTGLQRGLLRKRWDAHELETAIEDRLRLRTLAVMR